MPRASGPDGKERKPQLQIWDDETRETALDRSVADGDGTWEVFLLVEPAAADLVRGRLSFRREEERHDTAAVLVEESADAVLRRAAELPEAMLRQLLASSRD